LFVYGDAILFKKRGSSRALCLLLAPLFDFLDIGRMTMRGESRSCLARLIKLGS